MKMKKLLTTIAVVMIVLFAGCKKDTYKETPGLCPLVVSTDPINLATGVPLNKIITATFNVNMNGATITPSTFIIESVAKGESLVTGTVTTSGMVATFTPSSLLLPNTQYKGTLSTTIKDLLGNSLQADYVWTFTTGLVPTVISTSPLNNATAVLFNKVVTATFSAAMDPLTLTSTTVTLANGATPVASSSITYSGTTVSFTPAANLLPGTLYTATITTGAKSAQGIPLASNYVWTFTTATVPTVILADPLNLATNVALNKVVRATFSEVMDPLTITGTTFTLLNGVTPVAGAVTYAGSIASFTPTVDLLAGTTYTATVTTGVKNVAGIPMASNFVWTFTTIPAVTFTLNVTAVNGTVVKNPNLVSYTNGTVVQLTATPDAGYSFTSWSGDKVGVISPTTILMNGNKNVTANFTLLVAVCPTIVPLGLAGDYVILAESGISTTGVTSVTGNMGISPSAATFITGFGLILPAGGAFSTSSLVTGEVYAPGYAAPTPANLVTAITDMTTAYTTANGLTIPAPVNELMAGNLNGQTLAVGIYKWSSNVTITNGIVLDGGGDNCSTFIMQIAGDLTVANGAIITLQNGAQAKNIFWVVAGSKAELGTTVDFSGNILCATLISLNTGAKVTGRLMSQTAVTLISSTVILP